MALSALCGALLVTGDWAVRCAAPRGNSRAPAPVRGVERAARASAHLGCRLAMPAALIAASIERSVPPYATKVGSDLALALGFAATQDQGRPGCV